VRLSHPVALDRTRLEAEHVDEPALRVLHIVIRQQREGAPHRERCTGKLLHGSDQARRFPDSEQQHRVEAMAQSAERGKLRIEFGTLNPHD
jgi:hypothetical protein